MRFFNIRAKTLGDSLKNIIGIFFYRGLALAGLALVLRIPEQARFLPGASFYNVLSAPIETYFISLLFSWVLFLYSFGVFSFFIFSLTFGKLYYLRDILHFMPNASRAVWALAFVEMCLGAGSFYIAGGWLFGTYPVIIAAMGAFLFWIYIAMRPHPFTHSAV